MKKIKPSALYAVGAALIAALTSPSAFADEPPNDVRLGLYAVFYHTSADDLSGPYVPPGVNLEAENLTTLYAAYVRHLPANFSIELAIGYPPLSKIKGEGPPTVGSVPYDGQVIATARWISPTLLVEYNFLSENSPFRPFIGVGVNYTTFYDRDSTAQGNAASGGPTKISLTASVGPAATAGLTYRLSDRWHLHASYSVSQVKSDLTADTSGVIRTTHVSFAPQTFVLSAGYSF